MSNEINRPWYRNPVYLNVIVTIIAAVIATIIGATWTTWLNPPPSDFGISVNPMNGEVRQGGVITTAITIKGIHGYEHPVALSTNVQHFGIAVSFVPSIGEPAPSYTSTVTINVNSSVLKNNYKIVMTGTGADGKEHSTSYTLTVKPAVTSTPTPTITHTPTPTSMSTLTSPNLPSITFYQDPVGIVNRGTLINFAWMITKEPPSYLAGEPYILEIKGPTNELRYSQDFITPRESCSNFTGYNSWMVPIDEPMGRHTSFLKIPNLGAAYIMFDVVETLLVIQKLDDKDKRLPGWEFKVTDPSGNTATYTTDSWGEIIIEIPGEYGGETYTIEEIYKSDWEPELPIKKTVKVPVGLETIVRFLNKQAPIPVE